DNPNVIRQILAKTMVPQMSQGDLMPMAITKSCCELYETLDEAGKSVFLQTLARDFGVSAKDAQAKAREFIKASATGSDASVPGQLLVNTEMALRNALTPAYDLFFHRASRCAGGIKFIIDLRHLLLKLVAQNRSDHDIVALNRYLRDKLQNWLVGVLDLQRITWNSPASTLEKLSNYEAVHAISGWDDLKKRVGPGRRCYGFFHHSMPYEPLVFVQVSNTWPCRAWNILHDPKPQLLTVDDARCAIFYSITSQRGLAGVELGSFLIKRVVGELQTAYPSLEVFCTLSPIPGFRSWLLGQFGHPASALKNPAIISLQDRKRLEQLGRRIPDTSDSSWIATFKQLVSSSEWMHDPDSYEVLRPILLRLCADYLLCAKRGKFALDPVANFHIRNGAQVHRINWMGDTSPKGMKESLGMMVNYNYILANVEHNNYNYTRNGVIAVSDSDPWLSPFKGKL
ncbi:malonyl-CoA decarboxylase-domain-containing protein, partial [Dimargaris cristalligena]